MDPRFNLDNLDFRLKLAEVRTLSSDKQAQLRRDCQTNLRFLVNCVLRPDSRKFISLSERCHGRMIDTFLRMEPGVTFDQWSPVKERITLASRGIIKSTMGAGFLTQAVLCDPDIRILVVSGKMSLCETILESARKPFFSNEVLTYLFPEWAVEEEEDLGAKDFFLCPRRNHDLNLRDPTMSVATFDSVKAGGHFELIFFDDCTNEINNSSLEMAEKNEQHYDDTDPLVEPGGYRHFMGTRWAPDDIDLPQVLKRRGEVHEEETGEKNTTYLALPAWTLREGATYEEKEAIIERDRRNQLHPEDVILTWPEKLSSKVLWPKYRANPVKFNMQYLLRYTGSFLVESFPRDLLLRNTRPFAEGMPAAHDRWLAINWDLSGIHSGVRPKRTSDFTCGLAVMFELSTRRVFVYDAVLEVFSSSTDMARAIVQFYARQLRIAAVGICGIEDTLGARMLQGEINMIAQQLKVPIVINWNRIEMVANSKAMAIAKLSGAMKSGKVQFSSALPQRDEIFRQFEKWTPNAKRRKDDAPDCLAQIWKRYSDQIGPGTVPVLQPSDQPLFAPDGAPDVPDPHADERENADITWLQSMTVPHAGQGS